MKPINIPLYLLIAATGAVAGRGVSAQQTPSDAQPTPKVLIIGIDGVRPDVLAQAHTPALDALAAAGTFTAGARTGFPTVSGPGWSSFLTGVWPDKHGVLDNEFGGKNYRQYPDVFTRIETVKPDLRTWVVADWAPLVTSDHNGPVISDAVDEVHALDGYELGWLEADEESVRLAVAELSGEDPDAMFVYLGNPDETSHQHGSIGAEYVEAIEAADDQVGRLVDAVRGRSTHPEEDWLILVSTDHGRRPDGGHGGDSAAEYTVFYIASGPSARLGEPLGPTYVVDLPVTALAHLGILVPPAWDLDGKVVGLEARRQP